MKQFFFNNNIELIRLLAAMQVLISHSIHELSIETTNPILNGFMYILHLFPGVPIFFFISGYLISKSYENSSNLKIYVKKRILRIYPALFIAVFLGLISIYLSGYIEAHNITINEILIWVFTKLTIFQFYNPEFNRAYATGIVNPALWTISIELQFYIMIPILYKLFLDKNNDKVLYMLIIISLIINYTSSFYLSEYHDFMPFKLLGVSFVPWIYMFLTGVLFQRNFTLIYSYINGGEKVLFLTLVLYYLFDFTINPNIGNYINPIAFLFLVVIIFTLAYSFIGLSKFIKSDLSYGLYVYHMIIVNLFVYYGFTKNLLYEVIFIVIVFFMAYISWIYVEKPILKLKGAKNSEKSIST